MELIYNSVIKEDLNLKEIEEILNFIFMEFNYDRYNASVNTAEIIDAFLKIEQSRFGEISV